MSEFCLKHIEEAWKVKTNLANKLFDKGCFDQALTGYTESLARAEVLNQHRESCKSYGIPFVQVFIISCNNLSNTYSELGLYQEADRMLKRSICYIAHLLSLKKKKLDEYIELQKELGRAILYYKEFLKHSGKVKIEALWLDDIVQEYLGKM
ncbi:tetratricopeptide repeat protein [Rapidithrix thailandica]|uniref:Tetratricopeptide repeat protein n=1 Tax=Rapidithrix thailandica TaxID=413964 RepID=A0AAW9S5U7_9BACT